MRRDMELIRRMLLAIETQDEESRCAVFEMEKEDDAAVNYHLCLLEEAGLIEAEGTGTMESEGWIVARLTWNGHDFLDSVRDERIWNGVLGQIKSVSSSVAFDILKSCAKHLASRALGIAVE